MYTEKPKQKAREDHEGGDKELEIGDVPDRPSRIPVHENDSVI